MSLPEPSDVPSQPAVAVPSVMTTEPAPAVRDLRTGDIWLVLLVVFVPSIYYAFADLIWPDLRPVHPPVVYSSINMLVTLAGYAGLITFLIQRSGQPFSRYGLGRPQWVIDPMLGIVLMMIPLQMAGITYTFTHAIFGSHGESNYREFFSRPPHTPWECALVGLEMFAVGFVEELVWRGYLMTRIEEVSGSRWKAILLTSLLFGFNHLYQGPTGVIFTAIDGFMFATVFAYTRRLWPVALGHGLLDLILTIRA
jgi:membrane protease YdiL (CAAX protease family)